MDMIANLYNMDFSYENKDGIIIKRALICDKAKILSFVTMQYPNWVMECEKSILEDKCYIALFSGQIVGFACFDGVGKGYFGPIGIDNLHQNHGIGKMLTKEILLQMKYFGYGYAIIGWVNDRAIKFYKSVANASIIENSEVNKTIYKRMI